MSRVVQSKGDSASDGQIDVSRPFRSVVGRLTTVLIAVLLLSNPGRAQQHDAALQEEFLEGIARVGRKVESQSFRATCRDSFQYTGLSDRLRAKNAERKQDFEKLTVKEFECSIRGPWTVKKRVSADGTVEVQARNETYAFILTQSPKSSGAATLQLLEPLGVNPNADAHVEDAEVGVRNHVQAAYRPCDKPVYRMVEDAGFRITRVFAVPSGESDLVRVEYEYDWVDRNGKPYATFTDAYLIVDPQKEWAIRERGAAIQSHFNKSRCIDHAILEIGAEVGGIPVATRVEQTLTFPDDPGTEMRNVADIEILAGDVPKEEFYLSYYGLPEPHFETRVETFVKDTVSRDRPWLVYLLAGCGCLVVAYLWRRRRAAA